MIFWRTLFQEEEFRPPRHQLVHLFRLLDIHQLCLYPDPGNNQPPARLLLQQQQRRRWRRWRSGRSRSSSSTTRTSRQQGQRGQQRKQPGTESKHHRLPIWYLIDYLLLYQDYGECTPPVEKCLVFPRFPSRVGSSDRPQVPFSQLVRKLSEVEGIMPSNFAAMAQANNANNPSSIDEGVDADNAGGGNNSSESALSEAFRRPKLSQLASFDSASLGSCSTSGGGHLVRDCLEKFLILTYSVPLYLFFSQVGGGASSTTGVCGKDTPASCSSFTSTESYPYESFDDSSSISHVHHPV